MVNVKTDCKGNEFLLNKQKCVNVFKATARNFVFQININT